MCFFFFLTHAVEADLLLFADGFVFVRIISAAASVRLYYIINEATAALHDNDDGERAERRRVYKKRLYSRQSAARIYRSYVCVPLSLSLSVHALTHDTRVIAQMFLHAREATCSVYVVGALEAVTLHDANATILFSFFFFL